MLDSEQIDSGFVLTCRSTGHDPQREDLFRLKLDLRPMDETVEYETIVTDSDDVIDGVHSPEALQETFKLNQVGTRWR
jgi:hypothetical protein